MALRVTRCTGPTCNAEIYWSVNTKTNRTVPLDPDPVEGGRYRLNDDGTCTSLTNAERDSYDGDLFAGHHVTCPDAPSFKRKGKS